MDATARTPTGADTPRQVLGGRYELDDVIGRGGSAVVYRARELRDGRAVAVKVFTATVDPRVGRRRQREMQLLSGLTHPGLVSVLDAGADVAADGGERPFLVMELVHGMTLAAYRDMGAPDRARIARWGHELAGALAHVHAHGITHRDVTPSNVLLDGAGRARLTDFGIAVLADQTRITATDAVIGTLAYMSPEQVCGDPVGPPTDVYALGLVLLEVLTGRAAYTGTGREVALARLARAPDVPPDLDGPLGRLLTSMTAGRADDRPTAAEVAAALADHRPQQTAALPAAAGAPARPPGYRTVVDRRAGAPADGSGAGAPTAPPRRRPVLAAAGIVTAVGLAVAGAWTVTGGSAADRGSAPSSVVAPPVGSLLPQPGSPGLAVSGIATRPSTAAAAPEAAVPDRSAEPAPAPARAAAPGPATTIVTGPDRGAADDREPGDAGKGPGKGAGKDKGGKGANGNGKGPGRGKD